MIVDHVLLSATPTSLSQAYAYSARNRGCVRTPDVACQGEFDFDPCLDTFEHATSIPRPSTQRDALQRMASQLVEELQLDGAMMLPQDSIDGIRNTVWRMHEQYCYASTRALSDLDGGGLLNVNGYTRLLPSART